MTNSAGLLILCGGSEAVPGIQAARRLGLRTIVVDGNPGAPGRKFADQFIVASIYDADEVIAALEPVWSELNIDAVATVAADNSITVARVAAHFGLRAQTLETARLATDKLAMKDALSAVGVPIPWYCPIDSEEQLKDRIESRPGSYVLKPIDSRGSRGVIRLSSVNECQSAYRYSKSYTNNTKLILEEWVDGYQLSSESIVWQGHSFLCGLADRNYERLTQLYPYVVEDGGETPSQFSGEYMTAAIDELMDKICHTIGLIDGSIKGDLVFSNGRLVVIEFATRLSGGSFSTITIPLVYDYDLVSNVFLVALGKEPILPPRPLLNRCYQANRFLFLPMGTVRSIKIDQKTHPNVVDSGLNFNVGDRLEGVKNHTMRGGWALATGVSKLEAIIAAREYCESIHIEVDASTNVTIVKNG